MQWEPLFRPARQHFLSDIPPAPERNPLHLNVALCLWNLRGLGLTMVSYIGKELGPGRAQRGPWLSCY